MKLYPIVWKEHPHVPNRLDGVVNGTCMFFIDKKGVRKITYVLQSWPFRNGIFVAANNTKKLFEDRDLEIVKMMADSKLKVFTDLFVKPEELDHATLTLLTIYHMTANPGRMVHLSDVDKLLTIAKEFEKKYKETEGSRGWESSYITWENAIIDFYNANKPISWYYIK